MAMTTAETLIDDLKPRRQLTLGMIGGGPGSFFGPVHRAAMRLSGRWRVVAGVFSSQSERSQEAAHSLGVDPGRVYRDVAEMAARETQRPDGIDAALIVTPNAFHAEAARALLAARVPTICDKPLCASLEEADDILRFAVAAAVPFSVTYTYAGYPMVREARQAIASGRIGKVRFAHVEYLQEWLTRPVERMGNRQAEWRLDPARAGLSGALGDIGTHAFQLLEYVTGLAATSVAAELRSVVEGRRLDDSALVRLRLGEDVSASLWASQAAAGVSNALRIRVFGEEGSVDWSQDLVDRLAIARIGEPVAVYERAATYASPNANGAAWLPSGAPEGYLEALAFFYACFADAVETGGGVSDYPGLKDGWRGVAFLDTAVRSSAQSGAWVAMPRLRDA
jgi:predicted dehydrogenase